MTWLVTGASRGLGRHIAMALVARGHRVLACGRDEERLGLLASGTSVGRIIPVPLDLSDAAQVVPRVREAIASVERIDGVVNNAAFGFHKPFLEHTERELADMVQVNFTAAMQVCLAVLPRLMEQRSGHIVNIGSDLGRRPLAKMAPYAATKHALAGFSQSLLREVKESGIKVTLVNPGIIDTDFAGGREGTKEERWSLRPAILARLIVDLVEQPGNVVVDELSVHPLGQGDF
jgi:short-subunit dehydrogenase